MRLRFELWALLAVAVLAAAGKDVAVAEQVHVEESTISPIADMALLDGNIISSTERPPVAKDSDANSQRHTVAKDSDANSQRHTVADFIIHPMIAFKARQPEEDTPSGKQSDTSTTTASPWQLFGFNPGQALGSSVSSLAGSVSGWFSDRLQLPGLDSPVRDPSTTTSTSTTTTTTVRPDVVVKLQRRGSTRAPLIAIDNKYRPNYSNNRFDSFENDDEYDEDDDFGGSFSQYDEHDYDNGDDDFDQDEDDDDDFVSVKRKGHRNGNNNNNYDDEFDEDEASDEDDEDDDGYDEEDEHDDDDKRKPNRHRQGQDHRNRNRNRGSKRRGYGNRKQSNASNRPRRIQQQAQDESDESHDDDNDDDSQEFYYNGRPSMKRSQSQNGYGPRDPQDLINQIRELTRGQTPAQLGSVMRQQQLGSQKRRQQAAVIVNRNGQTVYMAPELMAPELMTPGIPLLSTPHYYQQTPLVVRQPTSQYPQPPLTKPLKRKGYPTQYITIPWSQLGISPPNRLSSIGEGIQSTPLILNIPQSAINNMQSPSHKKKRPAITPDAVPLLAEASLMDVFRPPKIPPSRSTGSMITRKPAGTPVILASKSKPTANRKPSPALLPQRIRPGTIVEKAPAMDAMPKPSESTEHSSEMVPAQSTNTLRTGENQYIIVGEDNDPGLTRQAHPVLGDARYVHFTADGNGGAQPHYEFLNRKRFAFQKSGRSLENPAHITSGSEQLIPVQIIQEGIDELPQQQQPTFEHPSEAAAELNDGDIVPMEAPGVQVAVAAADPPHSVVAATTATA